LQTSQTGGQWYNDTSTFSIPCFEVLDSWKEERFPESLIKRKSTISIIELFLFLSIQKKMFFIDIRTPLTASAGTLKPLLGSML